MVINVYKLNLTVYKYSKVYLYGEQKMVKGIYNSLVVGFIKIKGYL